jgi:hypothetical protein
MVNVICLGDSYTNNWKKISSDKFKICKVVGIPGKTAQGLNKQRNQDLFIQKVSEEPDIILLNFGEVDCAYTIWKRKEKFKTSLEEEINYAVSGILKLAKNFNDKKIILSSPIIPLVKDYNNYKRRSFKKVKFIETARKLRASITASLQERTLLVLSFQVILLDKAIKKNYKFITMNEELLEPSTNQIKKEYKNLGYGWHLPTTITTPLLKNKLEILLNE